MIKTKCSNCNKIIANKKLIKSLITGKFICRHCYKLEQEKKFNSEDKSFLIPSFQNSQLKINLINKDEELFLINKYIK